ncbi:phospholipase D-like domain-containing protein [Leptospira bouyouniensis]|uniref:phospholipase D-like domain-containing protein n=1 Tax=Leptospira bouyouniensis TaxID=2484911 RepID=UPI001090C79B|nr:phospholipase D-like domain-containing protein [Leptospira bouyouniensis]TGM81018.1 PLD-like domain protein [Leptospira bouyouniensis]
MKADSFGLKQRFVIIIIALLSIQCHSQKSKLDLSSLLYAQPPLNEIYFSYPGRNVSIEKKRIVKDVILSEIRKSKESIRMYVYSLDDYEILTELYLKQRSGVNIQIFGDKEEEYPELESLGFQVVRWVGSGIHHTKIIIFDRFRLFLGTGNFTSHGLETDHNVYWIQTITNEESDQLISTLEGKNPLGRLRIGRLDYIFAPEAGFEIQSQLLDAIDGAKSSIQYLIYSHFDPVMTWKLMQAANRGVFIQGIYNVPINPEGEFLSQNLHFPSQIWEDGNVDFIYKDDVYKGGLLHHKTMLVDGKDVYVGSYNYSVSARDKNKEIFVKISHPLVMNEFLMEWKRIQLNAIPISRAALLENANSQSLLKSYTIQTFQNDLFETNLFFQKEGNLDSNSTALSKQYLNSLGLQTMSNGTQEGTGTERFEFSSIQFDPIWEKSEVDKSTLHLQSYFFGTKVTLSSGEPVLSISIWDGSSPKENIPLDGMSFAMGRSDFRVGKNLWMWVRTENRVLSFCHTKQKGVVPIWMVYLINRIFTKQNQTLTCSSG